VGRVLLFLKYLPSFCFINTSIKKIYFYNFTKKIINLEVIHKP